MCNRRRLAFAGLLALLISLYAGNCDPCTAQATDPSANQDGSQTPDGNTKNPSTGKQNQGGAQNQTNQPLGPIVAGPGSTVVAPVPNAANSGLIVAAPGSTVVVQQVQPANQAQKSKSDSKTNSLASKNDQSTIDRLGAYANCKTTTNYFGRAGAIDALGLLGSGADQDTITAIAKHLNDVLAMEFTIGANGALTPTTDFSEFICFHVVQAVGNLGWGARCALPQLQMLRGRNPILDAAIDHAVTAMQNSPAPQSSKSNTNNANGATPMSGQ